MLIVSNDHSKFWYIDYRHTQFEPTEIPTIMRQHLFFSLLISALLLISNQAIASHSKIHSSQNGYFGLGGIQISEDGFDVSGGGLISGLNLNHFIAVESMLGVMGAGTVTKGDERTDNDINFFSSVRLRFNYHQQKMIPYFYLGYSVLSLTTTKTIVSSGQKTVSEDGEAGFSYGVGIDLFGSRKVSIFVSTGVLLKNSDFNMTSTTIGFRYFLSRRRLSIFR